MATGFNDLPANKDDLGLEKEIKALCEFILTCQTPMTVAIQGDWGTGKTSMMKMVMAHIENECDCVWFNTWQFSQFQMQDDVPLALLAELLEMVVAGNEKGAKEFFDALYKKGKGLLGVVAEAASGTTGIANLINNFLKSEVINKAAQLKNLKDEFKMIINKRLNTVNKSRMVIFVDDLDRMEPGKAVELLEVIKIFLDVEKCVFILAVDYGVVSRGVRQKYGADMDEIKGRSFFDKIIQLPFNLPVAKYTINKYLQNLLGISEESVGAYRKLAAASVGTNPRTLKRMANTLYLLEIVAKNEEGSQELPPQYRLLLFAALCLQMAFETVYGQMLVEGNKRNLLDEKLDKLPLIFADALERAPGRKEELPKRLIKFFSVLNEALSDIGESRWEQFCEVLYKSGLTASGSQQPFLNSDGIKNSFDPILVNKFAQLPTELNKKYKSYFDLLKLNLEIDKEEPTYFSIPVIFANAIALYFEINETGIDIYFWSTEAGEYKKSFKMCLEAAAVNLPAKLTEKRINARNFLTLPTIPWKTSLEKKDRQSSNERYEQVEAIIYKWCDALLPTLQKFYTPKAKVVEKICNLTDKIESIFKSVLPEDKWNYCRGDFGSSLPSGWRFLTIRKSEWQEGFEITIEAENIFSNTLNFTFAQARNSEYEEDKKINVFYNKWKNHLKNITKIDPDESIGQSEDYCGYVYFPEDISNWTEGDIAHEDFAFSLDEKQEVQVIEFCKKCAEAFASVESEMDAIAIKE